MIILKCLLLFIMIITPFLVGAFLKEETIWGTYLCGQVGMWAIFQLIAIPIIQLRLSFDVLFLVFWGIMIVISVLGFRKVPALKSKLNKPNVNIVIIIAILIILFQMGIYIFGQHLDEDDARWIAEANDALTKNRMFLHNPATGDYIGAFKGEIIKDVFSPWSMYIACMAKFTMIKPVIIAHTIYAPILLAISYIVYFEISRKLFNGKIEQSLFLLAVAIINLFYNGNTHTQSIVTMVRIWQGKAIVAAVIIPLILLMMLKLQEIDKKKDWIFMIVVGCASCLFSGMGIAISFIMISVYGLYTVICRKWNRIGYFVLMLIPSMTYGLMYYIARG